MCELYHQYAQYLISEWIYSPRVSRTTPDEPHECQDPGRATERTLSVTRSELLRTIRDQVVLTTKKLPDYSGSFFMASRN
jgi:hypothetical protein